MEAWLQILLRGEGALDNFEKYQEKFASNERLNDIYRCGSPAGMNHAVSPIDYVIFR